MRKYRNDGAKGALLDEYERALDDLFEVLRDVSAENLTKIVDSETKDSDCRSIQTILTHLVKSGYRYADILAELKDLPSLKYAKKKLPTVEAYMDSLKKVLERTEFVLKNFDNSALQKTKLQTPWGQIFDVDQFLEHVIVHILRHRRQIEQFKIKIKAMT